MMERKSSAVGREMGTSAMNYYRLRESPVEREIQLQHIHPRVSQNSQLWTFSVFVDQSLHIFGAPSHEPLPPAQSAIARS